VATLAQAGLVRSRREGRSIIYSIDFDGTRGLMRFLVEDIPRSVQFYSRLFDAEPTVLKDDYAKWMLDEPRVNFAISDPQGVSWETFLTHGESSTYGHERSAEVQG